MSLGRIVDNLGAAMPDLAEGELVDAVVVLLKVIDTDGDVVLRSAWSDGISWLERRGMVEAARDAEVVAPEEYFMDGDDE